MLICALGFNSGVYTAARALFRAEPLPCNESDVATSSPSTVSQLLMRVTPHCVYSKNMLYSRNVLHFLRAYAGGHAWERAELRPQNRVCSPTLSFYFYHDNHFPCHYIWTLTIATRLVCLFSSLSIYRSFLFVVDFTGCSVSKLLIHEPDSDCARRSAPQTGSQSYSAGFSLHFATPQVARVAEHTARTRVSSRTFVSAAIRP